MPNQRLLVATLPFLAASAAVLAVGDLNPPAGTVAATGKRLTEIEPRIPISATTTPGDLDSVFRIITPGSYYLTGNVAAAVGKHGIEIGTSDVSIDLRGFVVSGVGSSIGFDGIRSSAGSQRNITIRNGSVSEWGGDGINLATLSVSGGLIDGVTLHSNLENGLLVGDTFSVRNCTSRGNGLAGIGTALGCTVSECAANFNGTVGFQLGSQGLVNSSSATNNGTVGIALGFDCNAQDCTAIDNEGDGISGTFSVIIGCTANINTANGIRVAASSRVIGNNCSDNGFGGDGAGIRVVGADNRIESNDCTSNDRGIDIDNAGNVILRNTCSGNITNWDIVANNVFGPIIDRRAPASAAVLGNSAPDASGSTHPNANFTY